MLWLLRYGIHSISNLKNKVNFFEARFGLTQEKCIQLMPFDGSAPEIWRYTWHERSEKLKSRTPMGRQEN